MGSSPHQCFICFEEKDFIKTPCGHDYCLDCVIKQKIQRNQCPICRASYDGVFEPERLQTRRNYTRTPICISNCNQRRWLVCFIRTVSMVGCVVTPVWFYMVMSAAGAAYEKNTKFASAELYKMMIFCSKNSENFTGCWVLGAMFLTITGAILCCIITTTKCICGQFLNCWQNLHGVDGVDGDDNDDDGDVDTNTFHV